MKIKRFAAALLIIAALTAVIPLSACSGSKLYSWGDGELNVVCTNFPPFDFARAVGGDKVSVTILQDSGADLHNYSPTSNAIMAIKNADVFICVGGSSDEGWLDSALASASNPDLVFVKLTEHSEPLPVPEAISSHSHEGEEAHDHDEEGEHDHEHDEHVWTSLINASKTVDAIAAAFGSADTKNAEYYTANAAGYKQQLAALHAEYEKTVAEAEKNTLIFADRFPFIYMAHDYGLNCYAAFSGCSTEVNASFDTTQKLIDAVKTEGVKYIFITDTAPENAPALANTVKSSTGTEILSLNSCQSVTRTMIIEGTSYLDIMKENLNALKKALS